MGRFTDVASNHACTKQRTTLHTATCRRFDHSSLQIVSMQVTQHFLEQRRKLSLLLLGAHRREAANPRTLALWDAIRRRKRAMGLARSPETKEREVLLSWCKRRQCRHAWRLRICVNAPTFFFFLLILRRRRDCRHYSRRSRRRRRCHHRPFAAKKNLANREFQQTRKVEKIC